MRFYIVVITVNVCPELPAPESGTVRVGGRVVGGQTMYECEPGLVLRGDVTRTCQENGQWTGEQPICEGKKTTANFRQNCTCIVDISAFKHII